MQNETPDALKNLDMTKCFVCQELEPSKLVVRGKESFRVCDECATMIAQENDRRNRIKQAIYGSQARAIFEQTLGASLLPTKIEIRPLETENEV